jgi:demethylmenaquinone methyltransferase/2-methoxy-6-polyprenyl-1,4-benzoquinol methylase
MFDRIAPRYDLLNRLLSGGTDVRWRRRAVDFLELQGPGTVLDLCSGTADLLLEWLGRGPEHRGFGVDLSTQMLKRGLGKLRSRGFAERARLAAGDAERLPLASGRFDGALVAFGIRNVGDMDAALREVHRVLKPGAGFVILEFAMPRGVFGHLYRFYFGTLLPWIGGLVSGDAGAYAYLPASVRRFDTPHALAARLGRAGFVGVEHKPLSFGIAWLHKGVKV